MFGIKFNDFKTLKPVYIKYVTVWLLNIIYFKLISIIHNFKIAIFLIFKGTLKIIAKLES